MRTISFGLACALLAVLTARIPAVGAPAQRWFEFRSGLWINLHHTLWRQAELPGVEVLNAAEAQAWNAALRHYGAGLSGRDLLRDEGMIEIKNRLAAAASHDTLQGAGLDPELAALLEAAAAVYRTRWWPEHDLKNRQWIAAIEPLVARHGAELARDLATAYQTAWPDGPVPVDVTTYGDRYGAYTTLNPTHITIASQDARNQGPTGLEIVFHEASHALVRRISESILAECKRQGKVLPRDDLWHAVLFYTTGQAVRRVLEGHVPYAYRFGLYDRAWPMYRPHLEGVWQTYLDGQTPFDQAVARLVAAVPAGGSGPSPHVPALELVLRVEDADAALQEEAARVLRLRVQALTDPRVDAEGAGQRDPLSALASLFRGQSWGSVERLKDGQIRVLVSGLEDLDALKRLLLRPGRMELRLVRGGGEDLGSLELEPEPGATDADLESASVQLDPAGQPAVAFRLRDASVDRFRTWTRANIGRRLAVVVDGKVLAAPTLLDEIGQEGQVTGSFSPEEAAELALALDSGALPSSLRLLSQARVDVPASQVGRH
jgi:hypothetical protein